jgi:predicted transcriptional regulator
VAADSVTDITVATAADVGVSALVTLQHTSDNQTLLVQMILKVSYYTDASVNASCQFGLSQCTH